MNLMAGTISNHIFLSKENPSSSQQLSALTSTCLATCRRAVELQLTVGPFLATLQHRTETLVIRRSGEKHPLPPPFFLRLGEAANTTAARSSARTATRFTSQRLPRFPHPQFHGDAGFEKQRQLPTGLDPGEPVGDVGKRSALHKQHLSIAHMKADYFADAEQVPLPLTRGDELLYELGQIAEPAEVVQGSGGRGLFALFPCMGADTTTKTTGKL
ncbi:MAG TPA: hypothetical protein VKE94_00200, partial [Gemmataceae bacterium]|nr:hypothetical protein [Gemmataceae bacterium]